MKLLVKIVAINAFSIATIVNTMGLKKEIKIRLEPTTSQFNSRTAKSAATCLQRIPEFSSVNAAVGRKSRTDFSQTGKAILAGNAQIAYEVARTNNVMLPQLAGKSNMLENRFNRLEEQLDSIRKAYEGVVQLMEVQCTLMKIQRSTLPVRTNIPSTPAPHFDTLSQSTTPIASPNNPIIKKSTIPQLHPGAPAGGLTQSAKPARHRRTAAIIHPMQAITK